MKDILSVVSSLVMIAYTFYRAFETFVIAPLAGSLGTPIGDYFLLLVFLAGGATALGLTRRKGMAALLGSFVGGAAVCSWVLIIFTSHVWIWSYFVWAVLPEICFALAGLCLWQVSRSLKPQVEDQANTG
jgi:hypothetical protein